MAPFASNTSRSRTGSSGATVAPWLGWTRTSPSTASASSASRSGAVDRVRAAEAARARRDGAGADAADHRRRPRGRGQPPAPGVNLVTALRNSCGIRFRSARLALAFPRFYVAATAIGWTSAWDLLPLAAVLAGILAVFHLEGLAARGGFFTGSLLWVIHNAHVGSIAGIFALLADAVDARTPRPGHPPGVASDRSPACPAGRRQDAIHQRSEALLPSFSQLEATFSPCVTSGPLPMT
nr:YgjV family protein [Rhodovulum sp. 12E13]